MIINVTNQVPHWSTHINTSQYVDLGVCFGCVCVMPVLTLTIEKVSPIDKTTEETMVVVSDLIIWLVASCNMQVTYYRRYCEGGARDAHEKSLGFICLQSHPFKYFCTSMAGS